MIQNLNNLVITSLLFLSFSISTSANTSPLETQLINYIKDKSLNCFDSDNSKILGIYKITNENEPDFLILHTMSHPYYPSRANHPEVYKIKSLIISGQENELEKLPANKDKIAFEGNSDQIKNSTVTLRLKNVFSTADISFYSIGKKLPGSSLIGSPLEEYNDLKCSLD